MIWKVTSGAVLLSPFLIPVDFVFYKLFEPDRLTSSNESTRDLLLSPLTRSKAERSMSDTIAVLNISVQTTGIGLEQ